MATATPDALLQTLVQLVTAAADEAASQPGQLGDALDQALAGAAAGAQEIAALPAAAVDQLHHITDLSSLLVFVLIELSKLDPDHLSVGALAASNGWSRAIALTYRASQAPDAPSATIALALTDPGTTHGVIFRIAGSVNPTINKEPFSLSIAGSGNGEWRIPFSGGVQPPAQAASIERHARVRSPARSRPQAGITVGKAHISVAFSTDPAKPIWHVEAGIPVAAHVSLNDALGPLADVLDIQPVDEDYSPKVSAGAGTAPAFSLGHSS